MYCCDEDVPAAEVAARPRPQSDRQLVPGQLGGAVELGEAASLRVGVVAQAEVRAPAHTLARTSRPRTRASKEGSRRFHNDP